MLLQLSERVASRQQQRQAAEAAQQALLQAKAQEQELFEAIKAEFCVDTATVRSATLCSLSLCLPFISTHLLLSCSVQASQQN